MSWTLCKLRRSEMHWAKYNTFENLINKYKSEKEDLSKKNYLRSSKSEYFNEVAHWLSTEKSFWSDNKLFNFSSVIEFFHLFQYGWPLLASRFFAALSKQRRKWSTSNRLLRIYPEKYQKQKFEQCKLMGFPVIGLL